MTPVEFPDVELWTIGYLRDALDDPTVLVGNVDRPTDKTRRVIVRRDGGPQQSPVTETARLGIRVFAPDETAVSALARRVYAHLGAALNEGPVRAFRGLSGPTAVADPSGPLRYLVVELTVVGSAIP